MDERADPPESHDLPTVAFGAGAAADRKFPVEDWAHYEIREYLGSGAMGSVYKAWDRQLQRPVALKFLLGDNPALIERFQNEARAQARVEHDNLCKIHEVGETQGRHYIAMQFIEGEPLHRAGRKMTLTDKVVAVRDIARGLHEAHRAGLVHRDIKPSNIMVSRGNDGRWKPFVLDFGLAREAQAAGMTMTGAVVGTPAYMAPEQARGEIHKLDRRSDVYGLGATLYDLLTDRPPFSGETLHTIIPQVLDDVPRPPRDTNPEVPADIESIALKCLRKDPAERYESARALAEDLQRYLDGDAVLARPTSRWYRLRMKARKNRTAVRVAAVALPLVIAATGWALWNEWTSARQQELAQEFGQKVQRMESIARLSAMAPLHDIRPEQEMIRTQMAAIEESIRSVGKIARGPGQYALGRGDLALGDVAEARRHLEAAWAADYRAPEVSYALGLVLGRLYQERLQEIETISKEEERERKRAVAQQELRDPALAQFRLAATADTESPLYLEALMALYEDRREEALSKAREAFDERKWLYEAKRLEGEVLQLIGNDLRNRGDHDAAAERYAESMATLEETAGVAPSDPLAYNRMARVSLSRMTLELHRGGDPESYVEEGLRATDLAVSVDPENSEAFGLRGRIHAFIALHRINLGQDPGTHLDDAIEAGERAVVLDPADAAAHLVLGSTYRQIGKDVRRRGEDPRPAFEKAIAAYETAGSLDSDWAFHAHRGLLYKDIAVYQAGIGEDPREAFDRAIAAYEQSITLRPGEFTTHYNLGVARRELAAYKSENGFDPSLDFTESASAFRRALELSPDHPLILQALASVLNNLALYKLDAGGDPTDDVEQALDALTTAIRENPGSAYLAHLHDGRGIAYTTLLQYELSRGGDPSELMALATRELEAAIAANPEYEFAHSNLCDLYRSAAEHEADLGRDPEDLVERAVRHGELALAIDPTRAFTEGVIVGALDVLALHRLEAGEDADAVIGRMSRHAKAMRELNPNDPDTHRRTADVLVAEALRDADIRPPFDRFRQAADELRTAIERAPDRAELHLALANLYDRWARRLRAAGDDADEEIAEGLRSADAAIALNPALARAKALRGALLLSLATCDRHPHDAQQLLADARESATAAVAGNGHLALLCEPILDRIRTLSGGPGGT